MKKERGFTLIEMLVATAVFILVGGVALNLLVSSIGAQRSALESQTLVDQVSFVAEYMSRAIRQAEKNISNLHDCLESGFNLNYEVSGGGQILTFLDKDEICREFSLGGDAIRERRSGDHAAANFGAYIPLTSDDILVQDLRFLVEGEGQDDTIQPRVTFLIDAEGMKLQTTISQRRFDVPE